MRYIKTYEEYSKTDKYYLAQKLIKIIESLGFKCRLYDSDYHIGSSRSDFLEFDYKGDFRFAIIIKEISNHLFLEIKTSSRVYDDNIVNIINALPEYFSTINGINSLEIEEPSLRIFFGLIVDSVENIIKRLAIKDIKEKIEIFINTKKYNL